MKKLLKLFCFSLLLFCAGANLAQAEVFYWESPDGDVSVTFPDRWRQSHNQSAGDVLTVNGAGANDFATCRLNVVPEGRFKIYPVDYSPQIQRTNFSRAYWEHYFNQYSNPVLYEVRDDAALGRGFASMAEGEFETAQGAKMMKRGVAVVSFYDNSVRTVECSAEQSAYEHWKPAFMSFIKSVDFKPHTNYAISGYYREFDKDRRLKISGHTMLDDVYR